MPHSRGRVQATAISLAVVAAVAAVLASLTLRHAGPRAQTAPLGTSTIVAGFSFALAGCVALWRGGRRGTAALLSAAGFLLLATALQLSNRSLPFTIGWLLALAPAAVIAHLLLSVPDGHLHSRWERAAVGLVYLDATALQVAMLSVMGFGMMRGCPCPANLLLIRDDPALHRLVMGFQRQFGLALAVWLVWLIIRRWWTGSPPLRRAIAPMLLAGAVCGALLSLTLIGGNLSASVSAELNTAESVALALVPIAFLVGLLQARLARASVGDLVLALDRPDAPGRLRDSLAHALGDPSLSLAYWLDDPSPRAEGSGSGSGSGDGSGGGYVDVLGRPADITDRPGRTATILRRGGSPIAALLHDPALHLNPELLDSVAAAAGLELDNERLQAELRAQLEQLRASRARIVEAGDQARRRLERNLHDGAQQRLVAVSIGLGLAQERLETEPAAASELIRSAAVELRAAVDELRELARGLHPAILNHGLRPGLLALVERCPIPVELQISLAEPVPLNISATGYYLVAEALTNVARYSRATSVTVSVRDSDGWLRIDVVDDGVGGAAITPGSGLEGLRDRVEAVMGVLELTSPAGVGTRLTARVPLPPATRRDRSDGS